MALDPRITLAIQNPNVDLSQLVNSVRDRRNFNAQQKQVGIQNERTSNIDAQNLAQQELQNTRQSNIDEQNTVFNQLRNQGLEQKFEMNETAIQRDESAFNENQFKSTLTDNISAIKRLNDVGDINSAGEATTELSRFITNSNLPEEQKRTALKEVNSALFDFKTGNIKGFSNKINSAHSGLTNQDSQKNKAFAPVTMEGGGLGIPVYNPNTNKTEVVPLDNSVGKLDLEQGKSDIKLQETLNLENLSKEKKLILEEKELKIDIDRSKNNRDVKTLLSQKETRNFEANQALNTLNEIDSKIFSKSYGKVASRTPDLLLKQDVIDFRKQIGNVVSLLGIDAREKLRGQGTITDSEGEALKESITILEDTTISPKLAQREYNKVVKIMKRSRDRNKLTKREEEIKSRINAAGETGKQDQLSDDKVINNNDNLSNDNLSNDEIYAQYNLKF